MYFEFTKANTTAATRAFTLFPGATIVGMSVFIITAFDGGTTLSVGHTGSNTYYLNADSVLGSTGPNYSTAWAHLYAKLTAAENITFTLNGSPTVGDAILAVRYIMQ